MTSNDATREVCEVTNTPSTATHQSKCAGSGCCIKSPCTSRSSDRSVMLIDELRGGRCRGRPVGRDHRCGSAHRGKPSPLSAAPHRAAVGAADWCDHDSSTNSSMTGLMSARSQTHRRVLPGTRRDRPKHRPGLRLGAKEHTRRHRSIPPRSRRRRGRDVALAVNQRRCHGRRLDSTTRRSRHLHRARRQDRGAEAVERGW